MYSIMASVFNAAFGWLLRGVVIKFVILSALYAVIAWVAEEVFSRINMGSLTGLQQSVNALPSGLLFFLGVFRLDVGLPLIIGAMFTKFIIRRIPFIG